MTKIFLINNSDRDIVIGDDDCGGWALLLLIPSLPKVSSLMALGTALDKLSGGNDGNDDDGDDDDDDDGNDDDKKSNYYY